MVRIALALGVLGAAPAAAQAAEGLGREVVVQAGNDLNSALGSMAAAKGILQQAEERMAEAYEGFRGASGSPAWGNALEEYLKAREDYQSALKDMEAAGELYKRKKLEYLTLQTRFKRDHGKFLMGAGGEGTGVGFSLPTVERESRPPNTAPEVAYGRPPGYANSKKGIPAVGNTVPVQKPPAHAPARSSEDSPELAPPPAAARGESSSHAPVGPLGRDAVPSELRLPPPPVWTPVPLPNELSILLGAAESRLQAGDAQGALDYAEKAALRNDDDAASRHLAAQALLRLGFYEEAEIAAQEALKRAPKNPKVFETLAWTQLQQGKYAEAARSASRALEADPASAKAYAARAYAREGAGDDVGKKDDIQQAAALAPAQYSAQSSSAQAGARLFSPPPPGAKRSLSSRAVPGASPAAGKGAAPGSEPLGRRLRPYWTLGLTLLVLLLVVLLWLPRGPKTKQTR